MENRGGSIFLGGCRAADLVREYGSPLYVIEKDSILAQWKVLRTAFRDARILFAGKANPNPWIWRLLKSLGCGIDCCSPWEVAQAIDIGYSPSDISFTGTGLTVDEMKELAATGVLVHLDALSQLEKFVKLKERISPLGVRVNPGQGAGTHAHCTTAGCSSKLGIPYERAVLAYETAQRHGAEIRSLHFHLGSGSLDASRFIETAERMFALAESFIPQLQDIDVGGGIGVPHGPGDLPFDLQSYSERLSRLNSDWERRYGRALSLTIEPGQFLTARAGWLLMEALIVKTGPDGTRFVITDSSYNHYLGTALYQSYHEIIIDGKLDTPYRRKYTVCGHLCNTGDTFARDRMLPTVEDGDLLAMAQTGAYGISRSSNYNSRPIPAEVMVSDGRAQLIRRRQNRREISTWYPDSI